MERKKTVSMTVGIAFSILYSIATSISLCAEAISEPYKFFYYPILAALSISCMFIHEFLHYLAGKIVGIKGLRIGWLRKYGAIFTDYSEVDSLRYSLFILAPVLVLQLILFAVMMTGIPLLGYAFHYQLASSIPDIFNLAYFTLLYGRCYYEVLHDDKGKVLGFIVIKDNRRIFYEL